MITLDGFAVLKSIGTSQKAFAIVDAEVEKAADSIMKKMLKAKGLNVPQLRDVCRAVGPDALGIVIDNLADKEVKALVNKLDKHWPPARTARMHAQREHVLSLAQGLANVTVMISGLSLGQLRDTYRAVGSAAFGQAIDNLADDDVLAVVKKIDKHGSKMMGAPIHQQRRHIVSLAEGRADPAVRMPAPPRTTRAKVKGKQITEAPSAGWSSSMSARSPRG